VCLAVNTPCRQHLRRMRCPELAKSCRYICVQNSLHFSSYYCHRSVTSRSLVTKHPLFRQPSACLQGGRAAVHPTEEGSMFLSERLVSIKQTRSHIDRQYERANVTCKWRLNSKNWPLPQLGRAHNTRYFRSSSVWIFQSILSFSRVKQYGWSLVIQSSIF
jgi:hypothetical protein